MLHSPGLPKCAGRGPPPRPTTADRKERLWATQHVGVFNKAVEKVEAWRQVIQPTHRRRIPV